MSHFGKLSFCSGGNLYEFSRFCLADISEIVKTDCSICETVSNLIQTVLISYQF